MKLFLLLSLAVCLLSVASTLGQTSLDDLECPVTRVSDITLERHRPKPTVCTIANATLTVYDTNGNLLLPQTVVQKVATIKRDGAYFTFSSSDGQPSPIAMEYALLGGNRRELHTCLIQDFPGFGSLYGEVTTLNHGLQVIEYLDRQTGRIGAIQTLEPNLQGTNGGERLTLQIFYPPPINTISTYLTYVATENLPLDQCSDIITDPCPEGEACDAQKRNEMLETKETVMNGLMHGAYNAIKNAYEQGKITSEQFSHFSSMNQE